MYLKLLQIEAKWVWTQNPRFSLIKGLNLKDTFKYNGKASTEQQDHTKVPVGIGRIGGIK